MIIEAHYTNGTKSRPATVGFAVNGATGRVWLSKVQVAGKVDARKLAKERGAKPWNF